MDVGHTYDQLKRISDYLSVLSDSFINEIESLPSSIQQYLTKLKNTGILELSEYELKKQSIALVRHRLELENLKDEVDSQILQVQYAMRRLENCIPLLPEDYYIDLYVDAKMVN